MIVLKLRTGRVNRMATTVATTIQNSFAPAPISLFA